MGPMVKLSKEGSSSSGLGLIVHGGTRKKRITSCPKKEKFHVTERIYTSEWSERRAWRPYLEESRKGDQMDSEAQVFQEAGGAHPPKRSERRSYKKRDKPNSRSSDFVSVGNTV